MKIIIKGITKEYAKRVICNAGQDLIPYEMAGNTKVIIQANETLILEMPDVNKYEICKNDIGQIVIMINNPYVLNNVMLVFGENMIQGFEIRME